MLHGQRRKRLVAVGALVSMLVATVIALILSTNSGSGDSRAVRDIDALYIFPPDDTRRLVGFADDVFLGTVLRQVSTYRIDTSSPDPSSFIPTTQFSVRVDSVLKGRLSGEVVVSQVGGKDPDDGALLRVTGDEMLNPGEQYLLLTRRELEPGWNSIAAPRFGNLSVTSDAARDSLVERYRAAIRDQIAFDLEVVTANPPGPAE